MEHNKALDDGTGGIDESLYSRQLITLGAKVMQRMAKAKVFISGMDALGVEIAKNVALAGVNTLTVHDTCPATMLDLTNYYLTEENVRNGDNRATAVAPKLNELNRYSPVEASTVDLANVNLEEFFWVRKASSESEQDQFAHSLVVLVGHHPFDLISKINAHCHANAIPFIYTTNIGFFGVLFNDFGTGTFVVDDPTGLEMIEFQIKSIKRGELNEETGKLKLIIEGISDNEASEPKKLHQLNDGDVVAVTGSPFEGINGNQFLISKVNAHEFSIEVDPATFGGDAEGVGAGVVTQKLVPLSINFQSWEEQINNPTFDDFNVDWTKGDLRSLFLHSVRALEYYKQTHGQLPRSWNSEDADLFIELVQKFNSEPLEDHQKAILKKISFTSRGRLVGNDSVLGGFIAQEVVKAVGRKYTPAIQWYFVEALELVESSEDVSVEQYQEKGDRYDSLRVVIGDELIKKLNNTSLFMIGCGAIGCELMKIFAMLGVSTGEGALLTVTDNDFIEKSNLNRQFLFRKDDLDNPKSDTAAKAILGMNPNMKLKSFTSLVSKDTEDTFSDEFFQRQDLIVNALDNVEARLYVDARCVENRKALLESGTKGPLGHTQVIIPDLTINYGFFRDAPDPDFPGCTVKYFPFKSVHTIQWAKQKFQKLFEQVPQECNRVRGDSKGDGWWDRLRALSPRPPPNDFKRWIKLLSSNASDYVTCIQLAKKTFVSWYKNFVIQLFHLYPLDSKDKKDGKPFWSPPKKIPSVIEFDSSDDLHMNFISNFAALLAFAYDIKEPAPTREEMKQIVDAYELPEFVIKQGKTIIDDTSLSKEELEAKKKAQEPKWETEEQFEEAIVEMQKYAALDIEMHPDKFEKDLDANHHVDFIFAASSLRCIQYGIEVVDRLQTKSIAGRIIPAMATTTACVSGLIGNELIKVVKGEKKSEVYRNGYVDLARPILIGFEPQMPPKEVITERLSVTLWDKKWKWDQGNKALGQFIKYYKGEFGLTLTELVYAGEPVYMPEILAQHKKLLPNRLRNILAGSATGLAEDATYADVACHWTYTNPEGQEKEFENKIRVTF